MDEQIRKALELAMEAICELRYSNTTHAADTICDKAIAAIDAALSAPAAPVAPVSSADIEAACEYIVGATSRVALRSALGQLRPEVVRELARIGRVPAELAPAAPVAPVDWRTPTTYAQRFADAVALLCRRAPSEEAVAAWLAHEGDELQNFCAEHGPAWAQGIVLLDAAALLAETPADGADHAPAPAAPVAQPLDDITALQAELWKLAVRKGLVTIHTAQVATPDPVTKVSWLEGHAKACDVSNDAARRIGQGGDA